MTTLDDKLLGEKAQYYYSSSEDEDSEKEEDVGPRIQGQSSTELEPEISQDGMSINTGPKGVINDWRRYKQMQTEQQAAQSQEMEQLIKRLSMTCRSHLDEEKEKQRHKDLQDQIDGKVSSQGSSNPCPPVDDEDFLQHYRLQRMEEMRRQQRSGPCFGQVLDISSSEDFLDALDKESLHTLVLVHIYEDNVRGAEALHGCMACLATEYPAIKFCRVRSSLLGTSARFTGSALPALLAYRAGELIGNFVRLTDQLGEDFYAMDLEAFLQEFGLLPDKDRPVLGTIRDTAVEGNSQDSDLDID
ncbi:hypothetical protein NDU88_007560 [Pleurodeles waltl]|uniref:Phosducin domain-containing protein n=1 Tax=Pleurodeles waltl TaxID=8319 RepID=A0AAV7WDX3_PLEWA|nr:hypothetical protein NDU88_007560 [Pleurodeles waltl]